MTVADQLAILAFEAALRRDVQAWRQLGSLADLLDHRRAGKVRSFHEADHSVIPDGMEALARQRRY